MSEPNQNGHGADPQEIEQLLNRLRESIDIFESNTASSEKKEPSGETKFGATTEVPFVQATSLSGESDGALDDNAAREEADAFEEDAVIEEEVIEDEAVIEEVAIEEEVVEEDAVIEEEVIEEVIEEDTFAEEDVTAEEDATIEEEIIEETSVLEGAPAVKDDTALEEADVFEEQSAEEIAVESEETVRQTVPEMQTATASFTDVIDGIALEKLIDLAKPTPTPEEVGAPKKYHVSVLRQGKITLDFHKSTRIQEELIEAVTYAEDDASYDEMNAPENDEQVELENVTKTAVFQSTAVLVNQIETASDESEEEEEELSFVTAPSAKTGESATNDKKTLSGAAQASVDYSAFRIADTSPAMDDRKHIEEFVSKDQTDSIFARYKRKMRGLSLRLAGAVLLFLLLLTPEILPIFGVSLLSLFALEDFSFVVPLLSLLLFAAAVSLAFPAIREGFSAFAERKPVPECLYIISTGWISLYMLAACFLYDDVMVQASASPLMGAAGASLTIGVLAADFIRVRGEYATFSAVAAPGDKLAAELARVTARGDEFRVLKNHVFPETSRTIHVKKVEFVDGYFRQINRRVEDFRLNTWLLIAINAAALIVGVLTASLIYVGSFAMGLLAAAAVSFLAAPFSFYVSHRYPLYRAERLASDEGCAFIGESAVHAYTMADVMVFEDVEAFTSANTRICRIKLPDGVQVHQVLYYLTKAFGVIGGPLYGLFSTAIEGIDDYADTELVASEKNGLYVRTGGHDVHIGRAAYLAKNGIAPYYDEEDEKYIAEGKISLMYVAVDGAFMAKFYMRYEPNDKFCRNAKRLAYRHMHMLIRTFDPNLDDRLLKVHPMLSQLPIKMLHKRPEQLHDYAEERMYSGLVTSGSTKDILKLLLLCDNVKRVTAIGRIIKIVTAAVAPALVLLLMSLGQAAFLSGPLSVLYWFLSLIPLAIVTKRKL